MMETRLINYSDIRQALLSTEEVSIFIENGEKHQLQDPITKAIVTCYVLDDKIMFYNIEKGD